MRTYPKDSPLAAARIVALALLADGSLSRAELDALDRIDVSGRLGLQPDDMHAVVQCCCEDLLGSAYLSWDGACRLDRHTLRQVLAEVLDPVLRFNVLELCALVAEADADLSDGELVVLAAALEDWGIERNMLHMAAFVMPERLTSHPAPTA